MPSLWEKHRILQSKGKGQINEFERPQKWRRKVFDEFENIGWNTNRRYMAGASGMGQTRYHSMNRILQRQQLNLSPQTGSLTNAL